MERAIDIQSHTGLPHAALARAHDLLARCNRHDDTAFLMSLKPEARDDDTLPRYFIARDDERIVGIVEVVGYREVEGILLVDPEYRRRGIARALARAAARDLAGRGIADWLLVCDEQFPGGAAFAATLGARRAYFEHRLTLDPARVPAPSGREAPIQLHRADEAEVDILAAITAAAFGDPPGEVAAWIGTDLKRADRRWYVGAAAGRAVGSLRVVSTAGERDITAFGVLPADQGRGYGRALLAQTVALLRAESDDPINIEVETENAAALGLYRSSGFVPQHTYGYYRAATAH